MPEVGDILDGRYKLTRLLGSGAMGQVFVAENLAIGRLVAIKLLKTELLADPALRERFEREAHAIAAIEHRNVARFLDLVVGEPTFFVMEYLRGVTLADRLERVKRMQPGTAIMIARRLSWALEVVHQAGIIHRDIKPSNVMLSPDLELGEVPKLIDFGLAKRSRVAADENDPSRSGAIVGTPAYMSIEQIQGGEVDARSDVYSLGCLIYHLLAGRPPFIGDDAQVIYQHLHDAPARLIETPRPLTEIVECALAKNPSARFSSMRDLAVALNEVEQLLTADRLGRRRQWLAPSIVANALLALGLAGAITFGLGRRQAGSGIIVLSGPSGARVEVDGQPVAERTPTLITGLSPGSHVVRLRRDRGEPLERTAVVEPGHNTVLNVTLPPIKRTIKVETSPEGATLYVDGSVLDGETPRSLEVTEDDFHEVTIVKRGFEKVVRGIAPDDQQPVLTVRLEPSDDTRATLLVESDPAGSAVFVDGIDTGLTTPTIDLLVPAGEHVVEVRNGMTRAVQLVHFDPGAQIHLSMTPVGKQGK